VLSLNFSHLKFVSEVFLPGLNRVWFWGETFDSPPFGGFIVLEE
jgi:hypothetical protein